MPRSPEDRADSLLRFRGVLMRRRCDACGARIEPEREVLDLIVMKCPRCHREYTFIQHRE